MVKTKIFGTDISRKFIAYKEDGKDKMIAFDYSLLKGVKNVDVYDGYFKQEIEVISAYPNFIGLIKEIALITRMGLKRLWR